jgi:hypothetical protein
MMIKKRTPDDNCLLCLNKKATKTNSHIASKFLGKSILGKNGPRQGYVLDSSKPHLKPRKMQDSPKENYILCPECENYFEHLETYVSRHLSNKLLNEKHSNSFEYGINQGGVEYAICKELDIKILRLFIISLFWRCSISRVEPFSVFSIEEEELLREILQFSNYSDIKSIEQNNGHHSLLKFPIILMRPVGDHDNSGNFFYANNGNGNLYQLVLNEFIFFVSPKVDSYIPNFEFLNNIGDSHVIIALLRNETWANLRDGLVDLATKKSIENARKMGVKPYNLK